MRQVYLTGHKDFSNRGCEAIVRGTAALLRREFPDVAILVPSVNIELDSRQWPEARDAGVRFLPAYTPNTRWWAHAQHHLSLPFLQRLGWPFPIPLHLRRTLREVDAVLSIGGDNYSLDYGLPSLLMGMNDRAMKEGTPVVLWGASVGPFEARPHFMPAIRQHLARMSMIMARETVTFRYLAGLGLRNVKQVADPAFAMVPERTDVDPFWPGAGRRAVVGFNVSPLIQRFLGPGQDARTLRSELGSFVRWLVTEAGFAALLVPHVVPLEGDSPRNDAAFMRFLQTDLHDLGTNVAIMDPSLNAAQIKYVISRCQFFVGARTHATIAALSSGIPTLSIGYSIKSRGINIDLFGHARYVLPASSISCSTLRDHFHMLCAEQIAIRAHLAASLPSYAERAADASRALRTDVRQSPVTA